MILSESFIKFRDYERPCKLLRLAEPADRQLEINLTVIAYLKLVLLLTLVGFTLLENVDQQQVVFGFD